MTKILILGSSFILVWSNRSCLKGENGENILQKCCVVHIARFLRTTTGPNANNWTFVLIKFRPINNEWSDDIFSLSFLGNFGG